MTEEELIRSVAAQMGPDVLEATKPDAEQSRFISLGDAWEVAQFLSSFVSVVLTLWQTRDAIAGLVASIAENEKVAKLFPNLDPEKRADVMAKTFAKLDPQNFGEYVAGQPAAPLVEFGDKTIMLKGFLADRGENLDAFLDVKTRDFSGGLPILIPFADQYWWIVTNEMHWIPDETDGPHAVRSDIPKNFVCDLASVPRYLWSILPKTGKYGTAAIHHDWLCWDQSCTRKQADETFYAIMGDMGVSDDTRSAIYWGCRIFGHRFWQGNTEDKTNGGKRILKSLPSDITITWEEWKKNPNVFA